MSEFKYVVKEDDKELSVKELLRRNFTFSSRLMTKLKQNHLIFLNGESVAGWITPALGDTITVRLPEESSDFPPEDIPISVVYEDNDLLIINKQPGVVVHPTKGKPCHTIANGLMKRIIDTGEQYKIRFVNRLDMNTSGLLIVAKNSHAQEELIKQMKTGQLIKKYIAIVTGQVPDETGTIDLPLGRPLDTEVERWVLPEEKGGYPSVTHYTVKGRYPGHTLLELRLETGRTHQIRVHLSYMGYPILGDHLYFRGNPFAEGFVRWADGEPVSPFIDRQALHACSLSFNHPATGAAMSFEAAMPEDMASALDRIKG